MKDITIKSINVCAVPEVLVADHQSATTAYNKKPITSESVWLGVEGFEGDMVVDKKHHGGNDKAICCYNSDHFHFWKTKLGFDFLPAAFGENLTLSGGNAHESEVYIGDQYQLGEAIVEVSEPRGPCYMIGIRYNYKQFPIHLQETGFTGFYLRTIRPGLVKKTDQLIWLRSHPKQISVLKINQIRYQDSSNVEWLKRFIDLEELTLEWRERFRRMLQKTISGS